MIPYQIRCKCGKNTKQFKYDIGEFYVEQCCEDAGFDYLGRKSNATTLATPAQTVAQETATPQKILKPGRGKLRDMRREDLITLAVEKGLAPLPGLTKVQLIDLILG